MSDNLPREGETATDYLQRRDRERKRNVAFKLLSECLFFGDALTPEELVSRVAEFKAVMASHGRDIQILRFHISGMDSVHGDKVK